MHKLNDSTVCNTYRCIETYLYWPLPEWSDLRDMGDRMSSISLVDMFPFYRSGMCCQ